MDLKFINPSLLGVLVELREQGVEPVDFLKSAAAVDALNANPLKPALMRKVASAMATFLDGCEDTRNKHAHCIMRSLSKTANWHPKYDEFIVEGASAFLESTPAIVKSANFAAFFGERMAKTPGLILTALFAMGALGGASGHYLGKQVDEDHIAIEKQRAVRNEYARLANDLDRKLTAKSLKEVGGENNG